VVTGANSGIGFETANALARHGATVTMACRNEAAAEHAAERIRNGHSGALASIRRFADAWQGPLNLLVNNAGVMAPRAWLGTPDGFELQFGTNHLGAPRPAARR
jgi:NAD(P)-dependent dehydrogenase (short-subunit alcohol dehydrogenase family)